MDRKQQRLMVYKLRAAEALHATLDARIALETQRSWPDQALLQRLKRLKLKAKDEVIAAAGCLQAVRPQRLAEAA